MNNGALGRVYESGEIIFRQGDSGSCMYVIQDGAVEVLRSQEGSTVRLAVLESGDFFGELSLFGDDERSATIRTLVKARIITVDKKTFMRRIQEDATLAFRIFQTMADRLKEMNSKLVLLKNPSGMASQVH